MEHTPECFAGYMGLWWIESAWVTRAVASLQYGNQLMFKSYESLKAKAQESDMEITEGRGFDILNGNIAIIEMNGPMMKGFPKFGGVSTVFTRRAIRNAVNNKQIDAIVLMIDSPGGTVAGTAELAEDVRLAATKKTVHAQINDLGASAAFWVASQATIVTANATAEVGSIGTVAVLEDSSKKAEMEGIKVHVKSTGKFKGMGAEGAPITEAQLDEVQSRIDDLNEHFLQAVMAGRKMSSKALAEIADGRVFIAEKAKALGLIDDVQSSDDTLLQISASFHPGKKRSRTRAAAARIRMRSRQ